MLPGRLVFTREYNFYNKRNNMTKVMFVFVLAVLLAACNNPAQNNTAQKTPNQDTATMAAQSTDSLPVYTADMLDSKKDLVCGMPVSAGISDTAHYKGKAYGFCSKECKDDFVKNPGQYLSAK
jgi:YHS domain-containing protein